MFSMTQTRTVFQLLTNEKYGELPREDQVDDQSNMFKLNYSVCEQAKNLIEQ